MVDMTAEMVNGVFTLRNDEECFASQVVGVGEYYRDLAFLLQSISEV
jgi:hypothetical protein